MPIVGAVRLRCGRTCNRIEPPIGGEKQRRGKSPKWLSYPKRGRTILFRASARTVTDQRSVSPHATANSAGDPKSTDPPRAANRALIAGVARATLSSRFSLSTISTGVALGAPIPVQVLASCQGDGGLLQRPPTPPSAPPAMPRPPASAGIATVVRQSAPPRDTRGSAPSPRDQRPTACE